uniref:Small ribosomal subunit protein mS40 n=1 Tax=Culex tarsalis TaxID=7177 RepID=A0A1Q3FGM1_CULTA
MSLLRALGSELFAAYRQGLLTSAAGTTRRTFAVSAIRAATDKEPSEVGEELPEEGEARTAVPADDPKDRTRVIPVETSIRYLASEAYQQTYQGEPVWKNYRRNHKGLYPPKKTRKTCVRKGKLSTGNPCPVCRDEYLVLDHQNVDLLKQFISPQTGKVLSYSITGLCQRKHQELQVAIARAMDYGLITFDVPFRDYDYAEYYEERKQQ